jgi:hypothetical protein
MNKKDYSLALKFTAKTSEVARKVRGLTQNIDMRLSTSSSRAVRSVGRIVSRLGSVTSAIMRIGGVIGGVFVGGLQLAFGLVGRIGRALAGLPLAGLKLLAVGGAAVFAGNKALAPAGEMERYKVQLDVMKKSGLYKFLTMASAGKPFQMGETVQAGVLMEAFKIDSRKFLSTVMDAAAGFKKPLEEIVRMLGYARSGRSGEAIESAGNIGITRGDLKRFGIRFEKSGAVTAETTDKLMTAIIGLMKSRFGGMANRIGTGTYEGAKSDLKDSVFRAFANAGKKFLPYGTKIVRNISGIVTSMGNRLAGLPWDKWGAKLASGVKSAGNIIDNLFDPKRRADISKSIADGWNNIKADIPKLGKAVVLDLVDVAFSASAPKITNIFSSVFSSGGKILGVLIADPLINIWNVVWMGITSFAKSISMMLADTINVIRKSYTWSQEGRRKIDENTAKHKKQMEANHAKLLLKGLVKTNTEAILEKWKKEMAKFDTGSKGDMSRTKGILAKMRENSGIDKIVEQLTAPVAGPKLRKPITLSMLYPGRDTGYINGQPQPLTSEQLQGNAALQTLARMLPDVFNIKKETDVFGREIKQFSNDFKIGNDKNLDFLKLMLSELKKLNKVLGGA